MKRSWQLLGLALLLPLTLLAASLTYYTLTLKQDNLRIEALRLAQDIHSNIEREISYNVQLLQMLAQSPLLDSSTPDLAAFHNLATRFTSAIKTWDRVILNDPLAKQVINTSVPFGSPLPNTVVLDDHQKVLQTRAPVVGAITTRGPLARDGLPRISFRVPVIRDDQVRFDLTAVISTEALSDLLSQGAGDKRWRPFLIDGADKVVAAPRNPQTVGGLAGPAAIKARAEGAEGLYEGSTPDGFPVMTAFVKSTQTGWSTHVSILRTDYNRPLRQAYMALAGAVGAVLAFTAVLYLALRKQHLMHQRFAEVQERSSRLEALGRIAGGVAHDFNNILMVISSSADIVKRRSQDPNISKFIDAIADAAGRGTRVTRDLLAFARPGAHRPERTELAGHLAGLETILRQSLRGNTEFKLILPTEPAYVYADPVQLDMALLNLCANARDAMPSGGTLTIILAPQDPLRPDMVSLRVTDTGSGIDPEHLGHIFEPFFSTKGPTSGTGLGLTQVYSFVKSAQGDIEVSSEKALGTTFTLLLPRVAAPVQSYVVVEEDVQNAPDNKILRVLLIDDNDAIRSTLSDELRVLGLEVTALSNADEAFRLLQDPSEFDVIVTDMVMPGTLSGLDLARWVRQNRPTLATILISGYSDSVAEAAREGFSLLRKPFTAQHLVTEIRRLDLSRDGTKGKT